MVLNFAFEVWDVNDGTPDGKCSTSDYWHKICIENIAVHEFGHALGFAHGNNHSETDESCKQRDSYYDPEAHDELTDYDPVSVMNYCYERIYAEPLKLSELDIQGLQCVYGKPKEEEADQ